MRDGRDDVATELLPLLEAFGNGFPKPSFSHFTLLVVSLWPLLIITGGPVSLVRMWAESQLTQH
jgi:tryptophan-rich sensory protein